MRTLPALAAALVLLSLSAQGLAATPRENVDHVAGAIAAGYFDPAKGKAIADDLRAAAAKGQFDALTDPRDLATALTTRLQPLDHHFAVMWSPPAVPARSAPQGASQGPPPGQDPWSSPAPTGSTTTVSTAWRCCRRA